MKRVIDLFNEINLFPDNKYGLYLTIRDAKNYVYKYRIYVHDILDEELPNDIMKLVVDFIENHYNPEFEELINWENLLKYEIIK